MKNIVAFMKERAAEVALKVVAATAVDFGEDESAQEPEAQSPDSQ